MNTASVSVSKGTVTLGIPLVKSNINVEKRIVSGWATIDNIDQMGDEVTADASLKAFREFKGNVREMHDDKKAVGKVVTFEQRPVLTADGTKKTGIYVDVYVSKGSQDTWEKVLDGTLSAFSIKGPIMPGGKRTEFRKSINRSVNVITDYRLHELSLVDNPGNELCNVLSIQKVNDTQFFTGAATGLNIKNVFWCPNDEIAVIDDAEVIKCHCCSQEMINKGWFEHVDGIDDSKEIRKLLEDDISPVEEDLNVAKGGPDMSDKKVDTDGTKEVTKVTEPAEEKEVTKTVSEPNLDLIAKAVQEIKDSLDALHEGDKDNGEALNSIKKTISDVEKSVEKSLTELNEKYTDLENKFNSFKDGLDDVTKRLDTVESGDAVRKSLDVGSEDLNSDRKASFWSSKFLPDGF